jgi:hypothetical protein
MTNAPDRGGAGTRTAIALDGNSRVPQQPPVNRANLARTVPSHVQVQDVLNLNKRKAGLACAGPPHRKRGTEMALSHWPRL